MLRLPFEPPGPNSNSVLPGRGLAGTDLCIDVLCTLQENSKDVLTSHHGRWLRQGNQGNDKVKGIRSHWLNTVIQGQWNYDERRDRQTDRHIHTHTHTHKHTDGPIRWSSLTLKRKGTQKWILGKYGGRAWIGFIWLRIGISGGLLWTRKITFGFDKMFWLAERSTRFWRDYLLCGVSCSKFFEVF
jgi:hypothetical protein